MTATKRPSTSELSEFRLCKCQKISPKSNNAASTTRSHPAQTAISPKPVGNKRTSSQVFKSSVEETGLSMRELFATLDKAAQINEQSEEAFQEEKEKEERGENGKDALEDSGSNEATSRELSEDGASDEVSYVASDVSEAWLSDSSDDSDYSEGEVDDSEEDDEPMSTSELECDYLTLKEK
ncbi:hypothetical protein BCR43DRAFT_501728 [Syncephalastrum racemosum]|uniref:Uncharacterized protein n=1 Tax=Syncephalastrum racemosum TaxID=13706 RepID=A0A1X2HWJ4_SYNRA|nr:hypothetical protein BCR43DRAFT_501728 [Syncephalastrum racemosum]